MPWKQGNRLPVNVRFGCWLLVEVINFFRQTTMAKCKATKSFIMSVDSRTQKWHGGYSANLSGKKLKTVGVYLEPSQTSNLELFAKLFNSFQSLTIFAKRLFTKIVNGRELLNIFPTFFSFIVDVWFGTEYTSGLLRLI